MSFSVTGRLLPGPPTLHNPEVKVKVLRGGSYGISCVNVRGNVSFLYRLGCIPIVSTVTGLSQAFLGTVHAIVHLACSIFKKNREHNLKEVFLGVKHIGIGLSAAVPLIGNLFMCVFCMAKIRNSERIVSDGISRNQYAYPEGEYSI